MSPVTRTEAQRSVGQAGPAPGVGVGVGVGAAVVICTPDPAPDTPLAEGGLCSAIRPQAVRNAASDKAVRAAPIRAAALPGVFPISAFVGSAAT
jgi:hypothetical protein